MKTSSLEQALRDALDAHLAWKKRLENAMIEGAARLDPEQISCDHSCAFGKFLHGGGIDPQIKSTKPYEVIARLHKEFHEIASRVAILINLRKLEEAMFLLSTEFKQRSDTLMRAINKWQGELRQRRAA